MAKDRREGSISDPIFYLDDKKFIGFDAHEYLRESCGFTNEECVKYLVLLTNEALRNRSI